MGSGESNDTASGSPRPEWFDRGIEAGWSEELIARIVTIRLDFATIAQWLDNGFPSPEVIEAYVADQERVFEGSLRLREATWADAELVADLYANAPEDVGDWEVTTERSPFPYAQLRLQENPNLQILVERGVGLGARVGSTRNTLIAGIELPVGHMSGWRVRSSHRGKGYARLLQMAAGPGSAWFPLVSYWYVRSGNLARTWVDKVIDDFEDRPSETRLETQGLAATVTHLSPKPLGDHDASDRGHIRNANVDDLEKCVELINSTTEGLDLVRPITPERLRVRLDDPSWGTKPPFWAEVYDWHDFWIYEIGGVVTACAGLWDRGRHMRDHWVHKETGESTTIESTAVLDLGFTPEQTDDAANLLAVLAAKSYDLGRTTMMVALEHNQDLLELLTHLNPEPETRALHLLPMAMPGLEFEAPTVTKPHTDLAYW